MTDREISNLIRLLLSVLPDSENDNEEWSHCWDELGDEAQGKVKSARHAANTILNKLQIPKQ